MVDNKSVLIVILNWNGAQDTIDCCSSLSVINDDVIRREILIIDNNSSEDDFKFLKNGFSGLVDNSVGVDGIKSLFFDKFNIIEWSNLQNNVTLLRSSTNHGFAKGCNIGSVYAELIGHDFIMFLNNDTVVQVDFMGPLIEGMKNADAVIPQIRYFYDKCLIWNCGGEINRFGKRKYYYADQSASEVIDKPFRVSFATGCCLVFKTSYFRSIGKFSENFFFGEEDIDLSLRLLKLKAKLYCIPASVIYHKVGASLNGNEERALNKSYIHYLNRLINMKVHLGLFWWLWLIPSVVKVFVNLHRINKIGFIRALSFIRCLLSDAIALNSVTKNKFESTINNGFMFSYEEDRQCE